MDIKEIRKHTNKAQAAYARAQKEKYALGAFNIDNQETLIAVAEALAAKEAVAMVEVSDGEVEMLGHANVRDMVDNYIAQYGIELYINLDHSPSIEAAKKGIDAGFEFIHIDISQANHQATEAEIIAATKEVVAYAKRTGALVESEPHYFAGGSNVFKDKIDYEQIKKTFTKPEDAKQFINATGIDTFAAAIGNLHGKYPVPKKLDIDLLKQIRAVIPREAHISLHGGSGTAEHYYHEAIASGVTKVNINSDLRYTFRTELEKVLEDNTQEYAVVKLMPEVIKSVQKVVEAKLEMFGSVGKARV